MWKVRKNNDAKVSTLDDSEDSGAISRGRIGAMDLGKTDDDFGLEHSRSVEQLWSISNRWREIGG